jgi:hypothetical protein
MSQPTVGRHISVLETAILRVRAVAEFVWTALAAKKARRERIETALAADSALEASIHNRERAGHPARRYQIQRAAAAPVSSGRLLKGMAVSGAAR